MLPAKEQQFLCFLSFLNKTKQQQKRKEKLTSVHFEGNLYGSLLLVCTWGKKKKKKKRFKYIKTFFD